MMTSHEKPCDFGHYLQLNRKSKGKSLEEVSAVTKIPVSRLKQLEEQDMTNLPASVFVKGFVRAYAAAVGADVADALQRFDFCCATCMPNQQAVAEKKETSSGYWPRLLLAVVLLAALISVTFLTFGIMNPGVNNKAPVDHTAKEAIAVEPAPEPASAKLPEKEIAMTATPELLDKDTPATMPPSDTVEVPAIEAPAQTGAQDDTVEVPAIEAPAQTGAQDDTVVDTQTDAAAEPQPTWILQIHAFEPTWLTVSADEDPAVEMSLKPDEVVRFKASDHFNLLIGNAGGIFLTLNDRYIGVPGNSGQVINLRLP